MVFRNLGSVGQGSNFPFFSLDRDASTNSGRCSGERWFSEAVCHITEQDEQVALAIYFGYQRKQKQNDGARGKNGESRNACRVLVGKRQRQR